ncbi:AraC family transcriptional regulator [Pedobacter heparinus]|uniref:helix-turn-helix domain-containing protein n=1 Tax=Pedobacter heparinus TaxID=984 RepID=UPI00293151C1|nr:AraC family transcriptional regulator [Pedobacter heparinus]
MLILNIITLANLLLLFSLLYFRKDNSLPNKILALILINPGINFLSNIVVLSGYFPSFPYFYFFAQITCFLFAPLVYAYVCLFTGSKINLKNPLFLCTGVCMLLGVYFTIEFSLLPAAGQAKYLSGILNEPYPDQMVLANGLFIVMQQVYFTVAAIKAYQYKKGINQLLSNFEKTRWQYIYRFIVIIWILNFITITLYLCLPMVQVEYIYLPLVLTAIYFYILVYSFNQNSVFSKNDFKEFLVENSFPGQADLLQATNGKPEEDLETDSSFLLTYLLENEPFTNPDLTLEMLAKEIQLPVSRLSSIINRGLNKNFYDLINEKRVEKSKKLLRQMAQENTIEYIAYESGFNSRASFYRAFKKNTGITPTQFLSKDAA